MRVPAFFVILFLTHASVRSQQPCYGAECNPTGDPLGGGAGYSAIIDPSDADHIVSDKAGFLDALASAAPGTVIYIDDTATIDLTEERHISIPAGVTLASGRGRTEGGTITTKGGTYPNQPQPLFNADGENIRITGLRLIGYDWDIGDHHYAEPPLSSAIRSRYPGFEVDNCEIAGWGHAGLYIDRGSSSAYIHHNHIHHIRRTGLGYGICHGYATETQHIKSVIEANIFDCGRHVIQGTGTPYLSYEARYNLCLDRGNGSHFDMHGGKDRGGDTTDIAGDSIIIHHNTFRDRAMIAIGIRGIPRLGGEIHNNWFYHDTEDAAVRQVVRAGSLTEFENMNVYDNFYGITPPPGVFLPVSQPTASTPSGNAPLTVSFDGSNSSIPGLDITGYFWYFADGSSTLGARAQGVQSTYVFNDPGRYDVVLEVKDERGIVSKSSVAVTVLPSAKHVLSFWVKDSWRPDRLANLFKNEALVNGEPVWSEDVVGDSGWQHIVKDITPLVENNGEITLTFRTTCLTGAYLRGGAGINLYNYIGDKIVELTTYWDNISVSGFDLTNGDFEETGNWTFSKTDLAWSAGRASHDSRNGHWSYRIVRGYLKDIEAGTWGQFEQTATAAPVSVRGRESSYRPVVAKKNGMKIYSVKGVLVGEIPPGKIPARHFNRMAPGMYLIYDEDLPAGMVKKAMFQDKR